MLSNCVIPLTNEPTTSIEEDINPFERNYPQIKLSRNMIKSPGIFSSVYVEFADSIVLCSVLGPKSNTKGGLMNLGSLECEVNFAIHITDEELSLIYPNIERLSIEKRFSETIEHTLRSSVRLECYPKSIISINVIIIQTSLHDLSTIINAGSLALAHASVQLIDLTTSCSVFFLNHNDNKLINENTVKDQSIKLQMIENPAVKDRNLVQFTSSYMCSLDYLSHSYTEGRFNKELFQTLQSVSKERCKCIRDIMLLELSQYYQI